MIDGLLILDDQSCYNCMLITWVEHLFTELNKEVINYFIEYIPGGFKKENTSHVRKQLVSERDRSGVVISMGGLAVYGSSNMNIIPYPSAQQITLLANCILGPVSLFNKHERWNVCSN